MEDETLHHLLSRADATAPPVLPSSVLAQQVRRTAARRTRRRVLVAGVATTAGLFMMLAALLRPSVPTQITTTAPASVGEIKAELAALDAAARIHERIAKSLENQRALARRRDAAIAVVALPDAQQRVDEARDRAALLLLREAERQAADAENISRARESYRRAARLFPETPAGRVAAEKLALLM
jgi:hypothetical protein